jgi:hypothetical protein
MSLVRWSRFARFGAATLGAAGLLAIPAPSAVSALTHGPLIRIANSTSSNWSGYASTRGPFTSVSSSWVQPTGHCTSKTTYSSFWVGIDGDGSNSVEQTGSEVDCHGGVPRYYSWYEMYPNFPVNYSSPVRPGDVFKGSVTSDGAGHFTLTLSDTTQRWTHTQNKTYTPAKLHSAEIIAEAPSSSSGVLPLTNFGTVSFSSAMANGTPIGSLSPDAITMVTSGGVVKAQPSSLSGGTNFTDTWHHN